MHIYASRNPGGSAIARLTSLRQGFGGPPELQRRRKASRSSRALVGLVGQRGSGGSGGHGCPVSGASDQHHRLRAHL